MKGMGLMFIVMILGLGVASLWDSIPAVKVGVHTVLDPTFGALMNWNLNIGFIIVIGLFTAITLLLQKYVTDQNLLKTIKEEQKIIQAELKLCRDNPEKQMELSKKSMELQMKAMPITMKPVIYTTIPFILSFRWFADYFTGVAIKIFGIFTPEKISLLPQWVWAYIIASMVLMIPLKKIFKVE